jgi:hypothetical protein
MYVKKTSRERNFGEISPTLGVNSFGQKIPYPPNITMEPVLVSEQFNSILIQPTTIQRSLYLLFL